MLIALAALASGAFGIHWLWSAWQMLPPAKEKLTVFQVYPHDFSVKDFNVGYGSQRGNVSRDRLSVATPNGNAALYPPRNTSLTPFATDRASSFLTVHANLRSRTMLEVTGHGRTYLAYEEAAASARSQATVMGLFGLLLVGIAVYLMRKP